MTGAIDTHTSVDDDKNLLSCFADRSIHPSLNDEWAEKARDKKKIEGKQRPYLKQRQNRPDKDKMAKKYLVGDDYIWTYSTCSGNWKSSNHHPYLPSSPVS